MMQAWHDLDWKRVGDLFTVDGVLHSMMVPPVVGRSAIAARIAHLGSGIERITLDVRNMGVINGVVFMAWLRCVPATCRVAWRGTVDYEHWRY